MWYRDFFPRSRPRAARGGIQSQSKRGAFGQSWWAQRWIAVLESFDIGARLGRGRSYARGGQVLSIDVAKGEVTARVQGSRPKPYEVTIAVKKLTARQWQDVVRVLSGQALFTAKLLAGEMPPDIEKAFDDIGLSLFPEKSADLITDCSCPDWSNPCKHIAAVYYLLGEEFDRDPFLLFRLRGLSREELLQHLSRAAPSSTPPARKGKDREEEMVRDREPVSLSPEPLSADPSTFWSRGVLPDEVLKMAQTPPVSGALLRRLGGLPFWRGETSLDEALGPVFQIASTRGLQVFLGEAADKVGSQ